MVGVAEGMAQEIVHEEVICNCMYGNEDLEKQVVEIWSKN